MRREPDINPAWARAIVWALVLTYIGLFSWLSVTRHQALRTDAYDMGNVNQAMWNTVHGRPLYFTNWRGVELTLATDSRLAMHVEPIYFLMAPFYWLWQRPETLLVLQTVVLALGAWPVFWLASQRLGGNLSGIAFTAVYLLFPGLEAANLWEFHAVAMAAPFLLFAFYFGQARRWGLLWLFAILAMATKEEVPLTVILIGLYFAFWGMIQAGLRLTSSDEKAIGRCSSVLRRFRQRQVVHGLALTSVAVVWFVLAVFFVIPHFEGAGSPYLSYYGDLANLSAGSAAVLPVSPLKLVTTLFSERNIKYLIDLFTPVGFLSLLSPLTLSFSFPDLAINLLGNHEPMHFVQKYHYVAPLLPGVMISAILGAAWLARKLSAISGLRYRVSAFFLAVCVLGTTGYYHYYHGYTPLARGFEGYRVTPHHRLGAAMAREIPLHAAVSAQRHLNPQVSGRKTLYRFPYIGEAEYVFLDVSSLANEGGLYGIVQDLLEGDEFGLIRAQDGYLLFRRAAVPGLTTLPDEFYSFARVTLDEAQGGDVQQPQYPVDIEFGDGLRLVGFDLFAGRRTEMPQTPLRFSLYWQATKPMDEDYQVALYLLDDRRQVIGGADLDKEPGIVQYWYPTSKWQVGETIKMEISNMPWWTAQFDCYSVALGALRDDDPWDVSARLQPKVLAGPLLLPYADDGTLVELMTFCTDAGGMPKRVESLRSFQPPSGITRQDAIWRNGLQLVGYEILDRNVRSGGHLDIILYWRTQRPLEADYAVFVHLVSGEGALYGQHDAQPDMGGFPTSRWQEGEVIQDRHSLQISPDAPPGSYSLLVGFYDLTSGERVPLRRGDDSVELHADVEVR